MELANNALDIFNQGVEFKYSKKQHIIVPAICHQLYDSLANCVLSKKINILNHPAVRQQCQVNQWRNNCPGSVRRQHIQKIYRRGVSRRLYTQPQLDAYMETKNNYNHKTFYKGR